MQSKNKRPYDSDSLPPSQRLRANLQDLFASNQLTGKRTQELINDISAVGHEEFDSLRGRVCGNSARKLRKAMLKRNQWPGLYWAQIRVLNQRTSIEELQWCAFMLPHEYLEVLAKLGSAEALLANAGLDPLSSAHLEKCARQAGEPLVALGIWGDGVPVNWDRTESVETFSLSLPGQTGKYKSLRMPITVVSRKQVSENTWDDILSVVAWSLNHCAAGTRPQQRHDAHAWLESDCHRKKGVGQSVRLGVRGALVEVRGDWKMFGETFHFPKHNTKAGCCWQCTCTPEQVPT